VLKLYFVKLILWIAIINVINEKGIYKTHTVAKLLYEFEY